jgi:hypothetical protein
MLSVFLNVHQTKRTKAKVQKRLKTTQADVLFALNLAISQGNVPLTTFEGNWIPFGCGIHNFMFSYAASNFKI